MTMKERALTAPHEPQPALPDPVETAPPSSRSDAGTRSASLTPRNTTRDSWQWMWKDILVRIVPFAAASGLYAHSLRRRGISAGDLSSVRRDVARGLAWGIPLALVSAIFRGWVAPGYRLPTPADQSLQTTYYFAINAPAEELFWRGTVQPLVIGGLTHVPAMKRAAGPLGWALTTLGFGLFHRLGRWSWPSIAGVTAAGGLFGALTLARPRDRHALLSTTIAHGFATAGFLSWGDFLLHVWTRRRLARFADLLPRVRRHA